VSLLILSPSNAQMRLGVWDIAEQTDFFYDQLVLSAHENAELTALPASRHLEWLATRYILAVVEGNTPRIFTRKSPTGKPFFDSDSRYISLSHSYKRAAAIICDKPCGIDIQKKVSKITRIGAKFLSPEEMDSLPQQPDMAITYLHAIWGAKEAMYKAYGAKELDFRQHIRILPFETQNDTFLMEGEITKHASKSKYTLFCSQIDEYILVYGWET